MATLFIGSYTHNLDAKSRLFMPAKFREGLTSTFIINLLRSKYPCIQCFQKKEFEASAETEVDSVDEAVPHRKAAFKMFSSATEVTVDAQGRINIPTKTAERANLKKEAIVVGMGDHVEIWDPDTFDAYDAYINNYCIEDEDASESESEILLARKAKGEFLPE